jgi:Transcription factor AFT
MYTTASAIASATTDSTVTTQLATQLHIATNAIPLAHRPPPVTNESFETPELALERLQDWAFTQGFAVVTESRKKNRVVFQCVHHKKKTRNYRKLTEEDRERVETTTKAKECKWTVYVSQRKSTGNQWILG